MTSSETLSELREQLTIKQSERRNKRMLSSDLEKDEEFLQKDQECKKLMETINQFIEEMEANSKLDKRMRGLGALEAPDPHQGSDLSSTRRETKTNDSNNDNLTVPSPLTYNLSQ